MVRNIFVFILVIALLTVISIVRADEYDDVTKQLNDLRKSLESSQKATQTNEQTLNNLNKQLNSIKAQVASLENEIAQKEKEVKEGTEVLDYQKGLLNERTVSYYKNLGRNSFGLVNLLVAENLSESLQNFFYQKSLIDEDRKTILKIVDYIQDVDSKKKSLEGERARISTIKQEVDRQSQFLAGEVAKSKKYEGDLQKQIAELSARQQQIINARSGGTTFNLGETDLGTDSNASINWFRESAPSGYFGVFAFGAYTHRKGMSQYGARGRALQGQNSTQILQAYYGKDPVDRDTGGDINVSGHGSMNFEERYLLGIAEMPSSWPMEALKAQAIAARTYAYRYKVEGREICTTEACQVFSASKADNPPDAWRQAVQDTRGKVLEDVVTFYASTHGGFTVTRGWDTTDGSGGGNFLEKAYDKYGGSPWLYKAWYTQGYSNSSDTCGRSNPWLSPQEMADIVNAAIALQTPGIETSRITPVTTSCWPGNPYSMDELRNLVAGNGGISSASSVSVSQGNGNTNSVTIDGKTFSGTDFKRAFNLRAPGYLSIPQSQFAFFNIERK